MTPLLYAVFGIVLMLIAIPRFLASNVRGGWVVVWALLTILGIACFLWAVELKQHEQTSWITFHLK